MNFFERDCLLERKGKLAMAKVSFRFYVKLSFEILFGQILPTFWGEKTRTRSECSDFSSGDVMV